MPFLSELYQTTVKFVFLGIVAFGGIFCGIRLRKRKDQKESMEHGSSEQK